MASTKLSSKRLTSGSVSSSPSSYLSRQGFYTRVTSSDLALGISKPSNISNGSIRSRICHDSLLRTRETMPKKRGVACPHKALCILGDLLPSLRRWHHCIPLQHPERSVVRHRSRDLRWLRVGQTCRLDKVLTLSMGVDLISQWKRVELR